MIGMNIEPLELILQDLHKNFVCSICLDVAQDPVFTQCNHKFCYKCILKVVRSKSRTCPLCMKRISERGFKQRKLLTELAVGVKELLSSFRVDTAGAYSPPSSQYKITSKVCSPNTSPSKKQVKEDSEIKNAHDGLELEAEATGSNCEDNNKSEIDIPSSWIPSNRVDQKKNSKTYSRRKKSNGLIFLTDESVMSPDTKVETWLSKRETRPSSPTLSNNLLNPVESEGNASLSNSTQELISSPLSFTVVATNKSIEINKFDTSDGKDSPASGSKCVEMIDTKHVSQAHKNSECDTNINDMEKIEGLDAIIKDDNNDFTYHDVASNTPDFSVHNSDQASDEHNIANPENGTNKSNLKINRLKDVTNLFDHNSKWKTTKEMAKDFHVKSKHLKIEAVTHARPKSFDSDMIIPIHANKLDSSISVDPYAYACSQSTKTVEKRNSKSKSNKKRKEARPILEIYKNLKNTSCVVIEKEKNFVDEEFNSVLPTVLQSSEKEDEVSFNQSKSLLKDTLEICNDVNPLKDSESKKIYSTLGNDELTLETSLPDKKFSGDDNMNKLEDLNVDSIGYHNTSKDERSSPIEELENSSKMLLGSDTPKLNDVSSKNWKLECSDKFSISNETNLSFSSKKERKTFSLDAETQDLIGLGNSELLSLDHFGMECTKKDDKANESVSAEISNKIKDSHQEELRLCQDNNATSCDMDVTAIIHNREMPIGTTDVQKDKTVESPNLCTSCENSLSKVPKRMNFEFDISSKSSGLKKQVFKKKRKARVEFILHGPLLKTSTKYDLNLSCSKCSSTFQVCGLCPLCSTDDCGQNPPNSVDVNLLNKDGRNISNNLKNNEEFSQSKFQKIEKSCFDETTQTDLKILTNTSVKYTDSFTQTYCNKEYLDKCCSTEENIIRSTYHNPYKNIPNTESHDQRNCSVKSPDLPSLGKSLIRSPNNLGKKEIEGNKLDDIGPLVEEYTKESDADCLESRKYLDDESLPSKILESNDSISDNRSRLEIHEKILKALSSPIDINDSSDDSEDGNCSNEFIPKIDRSKSLISRLNDCENTVLSDHEVETLDLEPADIDLCSKESVENSVPLSHNFNLRRRSNVDKSDDIRMKLKEKFKPELSSDDDSLLEEPSLEDLLKTPNSKSSFNGNSSCTNSVKSTSISKRDRGSCSKSKFKRIRLIVDSDSESDENAEDKVKCSKRSGTDELELKRRKVSSSPVHNSHIFCSKNIDNTKFEVDSQHSKSNNLREQKETISCSVLSGISQFENSEKRQEAEECLKLEIEDLKNQMRNMEEQWQKQKSDKNIDTINSEEVKQNDSSHVELSPIVLSETPNSEIPAEGQIDDDYLDSQDLFMSPPAPTPPDSRLPFHQSASNGSPVYEFSSMFEDDFI